MDGKGYITTDGIYHEGEPGEGDIEVPARPSEAHVWDGTGWVVSPEMVDAARDSGDLFKTGEGIKPPEAANDPLHGDDAANDADGGGAEGGDKAAGA